MLYGHFGFITILDELYVLLLMEEIRRSPPGTYKTMKVTGIKKYLSIVARFHPSTVSQICGLYCFIPIPIATVDNCAK